MNNSRSDSGFTGSIPARYDTELVPLLFETYAADMARRVSNRPVARVLEIAAGTGVVTRRLAAVLPPSVAIVATDLNQPMLDLAAAVGTVRPVEWRQADAMSLPFEDGEFDAVVCQFGVMFFPEKSTAFSEAHRVLRTGGALLFSVWDRIEENAFGQCALQALETLFPEDPLRFLTRTPYGYHDLAVIVQDLQRGGFAGLPKIETVAARSQAASPRVPAAALCQATPLRAEIEARDSTRLDEATDAVEWAIREQFGAGRVDGKIQAHIVTIER